ncbi:hypothetical protein BU23DRAFT_601697 [Bimuria novae-zelandiae CBS 107.79]|uniref:Ubiquitin 3 binding protein But2 C-terminal domain-containing protein n=1 Tax=Bimuria novae-zelandiae CBS 107.79 TaxID=1447943 RepID=A0A6A5UWS6_9PLEO|nr:hypothetical protein BU23DRAFT_601697 [Bimuria novae-zelandiae CBS 107.79]
MRYAITPLAFAVGFSALAIRQSQQCFQLQASSGASGTLGQLGDGQNRIGGGYGAACYCLDSNGGFADTNGRGCILTPPTTQFQCDVGSSPTNGDSAFYACPANDNGEYNVYSQPVAGQDKCVKITLGPGQSCGAGNQLGTSQPPPQPPKESQPGYPVPPRESQPAPQPSKESQPAPQPPKDNKCPADLNGGYQYPHLTIPVSSSQPSKAPGTSYNATANGDVCSLFNFDIPQSYSGSTCALIFLFPEQKVLETSSNTTSGSGGLEFSKCDTTATQETSWDNKGRSSAVGSVANVAPGNSYTIASGACAAGQTVTYQMCATGGLSLEYFQDYNPSPIGAYVRECKIHFCGCDGLSWIVVEDVIVL